MTYYYYKIYFKDGKHEDIYLLDVDKAAVGTHISNGDVVSYRNSIINWGEVRKVKCHELADSVLTKIVDGEERSMKAANE